MLRRPFNGSPILTNPYSKVNGHYGEDYGLSHRTAIIAVASGTISTVEPKIEVKAGKRSWIANTDSDPYRYKVGKLVYLRNLRNEDYGNFVRIDHGSKVSTLYAHLDEVVVYPGQKVTEGQLIGYSDSTGNSTGGHIHYEIRVNNVCVDPNTFDGSTLVNTVLEPTKGYPYKNAVLVQFDLNVRSGPSMEYKISGSKLLKKGDRVNTLRVVEGQEVEGNKYWIETEFHNYIWAGGTDIIISNVISDKSEKGNKMTQAEKEVLVNSVAVKVAEAEKVLAELKLELDKANATEVAVEVVDTPVVEAPVVETPVVNVNAELAEKETEALSYVKAVQNILAQYPELASKFVVEVK